MLRYRSSRFSLKYLNVESCPNAGQQDATVSLQQVTTRMGDYLSTGGSSSIPSF